MINKFDIGTNIRRIMDKRGVSVTKVADELELCNQSVYKILWGKTTINAIQAYKLSQMLGVTMEELVTGTSQNEKDLGKTIKDIA